MSILNFNFLDKPLKVYVDEFAKRSETSVLIEYDNSVALATVCYKIPKVLETDYLPLTVAINDNLFSKQRIPGSYNRRENKPSLSATLASRIIDRSMRPFFDKYFFGETQLIINPLNINAGREPTFISFLASSITLAVSTVPFQSTIAGLKFALHKNDKLIINPIIAEQEIAYSKGFVAYSNGKFVMIDAEFGELENEKVMEQLYLIEPKLKELEAIIKAIKEKVGKPKLDYSSFIFTDSIVSIFDDKKSRFIEILNNAPKKDKEDELKNEILKIENKILEGKDDGEQRLLKNEMNLYKEDYFKDLLVDYFINNKKRLDGRGANELRSLNAKTNLINDSHGSGYFVRGETEVLSLVVLDSMDRKLHADDVWHDLEHSDNFFLHYNFPAFSVGEVYRIGPPKRRELGHGALAEKAIKKVLKINEINYTIRVNCEVLSSNGSSSQASICATSLALYDAGIATTGHVSGIAIGLLTTKNGEKILLTDIEGWEDHYGEMDFKIAHTRKGICSIQLDLKNKGLSLSTIYDALKQGNEANNQILDLLYEVAPNIRKKLKDNVLKCQVFHIPAGKTGLLIGPGGKNIKKIIEENPGLQLSIDDSIALIYHHDLDVISKVVANLEKQLGIVKYNLEVNAPIVRIEDYGIFVDINNTWALIHLSKIPKSLQNSFKSDYKIGDKIHVTPIGKDSKGRLKVKANFK